MEEKKLGRSLRTLTLDQFKAAPEPKAWEALFSRISGGTFTECHLRVLRETGIWIEELVPVFQKLDATLGSK